MGSVRELTSSFEDAQFSQAYLSPPLYLWGRTGEWVIYVYESKTMDEVQLSRYLEMHLRAINLQALYNSATDTTMWTEYGGMKGWAGETWSMGIKCMRLINYPA